MVQIGSYREEAMPWEFCSQGWKMIWPEEKKLEFFLFD